MMGLIERARMRAQRFEGTYLVAYLDPKGIWTSGTGFNLERAGAAEALKLVGMLSADVWSEIERSRRLGLRIVKTPWATLKTTHNPVMTREQADRLLDNDLAEAVTDLRAFVDGFDDLPDDAKLVLVDMRFNMGPERMRGFTRSTIPAIVAGSFERAARCIEATPYAKDTGARARENVALLRKLAQP